jgi:hypothetical protein
MSSNNVVMCVCGQPWSRSCEWNNMMNVKYLDTTKLTKYTAVNRQIAADPKNYFTIKHKPVDNEMVEI